jgi:hypothetical protein
VINFQFTGTVIDGGLLASTGNQISGIFSYDTDTFPSTSVGNYANYQFSAPYGISATVAGHTITTNNLSVSITDNFGGNIEDMVDMAGNSVSVDGNNYANGSFGFRLSSAPGNTNVLNDTTLPSSFDVAAFNAGPTQNYGWLQSDGGPTGQLLQFSVDSIAPVPLPPSLLLTLSGMLAMGGVIRRKSKQA